MTRDELLTQWRRAFHTVEEPRLRDAFRQRYGLDLPPLSWTVPLNNAGRFAAAHATLRQHRDHHARILEGLQSDDPQDTHQQAWRAAAVQQFDVLERQLGPDKFDQTIVSLLGMVH